MSTSFPTLLLLGFGGLGAAVARAAATERAVIATTRQAERVAHLASFDVQALHTPTLQPAEVAALAEGADVLVSFPPDGVTDAAIAPSLSKARRVVYISTTGVYGTRRGRIDDTTPVDPSSAHAAPRLEAEQRYRSEGAIVLRAPGLYDASYGLHKRLLSGTYKLPGDGSGHICRIHLDDLATLSLAALARGTPGETFVVGDLAPVPQVEVVTYLCEKLGLPMPPSAPLSEVPSTMRGDRQIDASRALSTLGVTLRYPTYREGFAAAIEAHRSA